MHNEKLLEVQAELRQVKERLNSLIQEIQKHEDSKWDNYTVKEAAGYLFVSEDDIIGRYEPFEVEGEVYVRIHEGDFIQAAWLY